MSIAYARMIYYSRSQGHNAVHGAAYRSGTKMVCERTGQTFNYSNRDDVVFSEIILPEGANRDFSDRAFFWNEIERVERRKDSQVAQDLHLALPRELNRTEQIALMRDFVKETFSDKGIAVDAAIHDGIQYINNKKSVQRTLSH